MNKTVKTLLGLLAVGLVALTSCKQDRTEPQQQNEGTTYVSVAIGLQSGMRADGADDNQYNAAGKWNGKDAIETVDVYVVSKGLVSFGQYSKGDFKITNATADPADDGKAITLTPNRAILTTPGEKEVYVLLNAPEKVRALLKESLPNNFKAAYNKAVEMNTSEIARANASKEDLIMMTNAKDCKITVQDGVTNDEALKPTSTNHASVQVKRAVARVLLTSTAATYDIKYADGKTMGTISNITYSVAQGEKTFYLSQKKDAQGVILTPAYAFLPKANATDPTKLDNYAEQGAAYDYSDLFNKDRSALVATDLTAAVEIGKKSLESSAFIFEASHKFGESGQTYANYTGNFRRGNTPYVLVRTKFVPAMFANNAEKTLYEAGDGTFYLGEDGLFYGGNQITDGEGNTLRPDQKYVPYLKGKVLYYAFVNPDNIKQTLNAPAYRNNIYHISVKGFKALGTNWNPLYPEDPDTDDPTNPDPKPDDDPSNPPFNPDDPNTPEETYMAVDVAVIPWNVHSYEIELSL